MSELIDELIQEATDAGGTLGIRWETLRIIKQRIVELESFKTMLIEALIVSHIYSTEHETDAKKALYDLIGWEVKIALDPQVSSDAEALIQKGRNESKQRISELEAALKSRDELYRAAMSVCCDHHKRIAELEQSLSKRIAGECSCPHSTGSSTHFPSCPMIDKDRIAELEGKVRTTDHAFATEINSHHKTLNKIDAVVECKNIILACLNRERKTMTDHIAAAPTCEALDKALAAIEALKQPDSGEQGK